MSNTTVYPFGTGGQLPSSIGVINDLTTGGADKALSAEMGKTLNGKFSLPESGTWGKNTSTTTNSLGSYAWPVFKPLDVPCKITKIYFNEPYASTLESNTSVTLYIATLNEAKTVYTTTSSVSKTITAGECSIDVDISLPAYSSIYIKMGSNQQDWMRVEATLSEDDGYPQVYANVALIAVNKTYTADSTYSRRGWSVKFDYEIARELKDVVESNEARIEHLEEEIDEHKVSYDRPTVLLALGSSLTDVHESYKGGGWLDILNDMVDVVIINDGKSGSTRQGDFQHLVNGSLFHYESMYARNVRPNYVMCFNTANMAGSNAIGVGALPDLEYGLNICKMLGAQLIMGNELAMYHGGAEFDQTYISFCKKHNLLVSPYCSLASKTITSSPYTGFNNGVHHGYRGKSYALAHYDLLKRLPIKKSIKLFAVRPDYQSGSPTYDQLIYDNNEERFVKFHAIKTGEGRWQGTKHVDNVNTDDTTYDTSTGTSGGTDGTLGAASSYTAILQNGGNISFSDFALCEVILDRINCTKGTFKAKMSASPTAVYIATRKSSFATTMSEWTSVDFTYSDGYVTASWKRAGRDFMVYDKVRILIAASGSFTLGKPSLYDYDGNLKDYAEPLRDYHIRQYGTELMAKTSCEEGWTMGGNASVQSLPTEIANYPSYNSVKSHIELASDSDYCTKSVSITQPCQKVAIRVVANLYPKIATTKTFSNMSSAELAKYISDTPTVEEYGYNFGTLRLSLGSGTVQEFIMWPGWFEYYMEADIAPSDTSQTLKIERLLAKSGVTTNSDYNVFIQHVSVQKIG